MISETDHAVGNEVLEVAAFPCNLYRAMTIIGLTRGIDLAQNGNDLPPQLPELCSRRTVHGFLADWAKWCRKEHRRRLHRPIDAFLEDSSRANLFQMPNEIPEGQRNDVLHRYLVGMRALGWNESDLYGIASVANSIFCKPCLPEEECRSTVKQSLRIEPSPAPLTDEEIELVGTLAVSVLKYLAGEDIQ